MPGQTQWCDWPGCMASFNYHKWGAIKAHDAGWFFQRDGWVWCPEHVPEWVTEWRAKKAAEAADPT